MAKKKTVQKGGDNVTVDLADLFKLTAAKQKKLAEEGVEAIDKLFDYGKTLPKGGRFIARFAPVERWKIGLQGFNIHGLERSLQVTRHADVYLSRAQAIKMIKTLLKPGDAELEDVRLFIDGEFNEVIEDDAGDDGNGDDGKE